MPTDESVSRLLEAWEEIQARFPRAALQQEVELSIATARALAQGRPLSVERLSDVWGMPPDRATQILEAARGRTVEVDPENRLVGAAGLTLNETAHQLTVDGKRLYAWCSWDAIFLPAYLNTPATIRSAEPVTGNQVFLEVTPDEVTRHEPQTTVLSILVPSGDSPENLQTGPSSDRCSMMQFFSNREAAEDWVAERTNVAIVTPSEALEVAHRTWLNLLN